MSTDYLIQLENVARIYVEGGIMVEALKHASCNVLTKDRIAIMGPSGSGKSTLLQIMGGLDEPTSGSIKWPLLGERETLRPRQIGFISQNRCLVSSLSVLENIVLPMILMGQNYNEAREIAFDLLRRLNLMDISEKLPDELSGGQLQRVTAVRALSTRPRIILADEPTGQLDHSTARHLLDILLEYIEDTDTALVIATHDMEVAKRMDKRWEIRYGALEVKAV